MNIHRFVGADAIGAMAKPVAPQCAFAMSLVSICSGDRDVESEAFY